MKKSLGALLLALALVLSLAACDALSTTQTSPQPPETPPQTVPQTPPAAPPDETQPPDAPPVTPPDAPQGGVTPPDGMQTPPVPGMGAEQREDERISAVRAAAKTAGCPVAVAYLGFALDTLTEDFSAQDVYGAFPAYDGAPYVDAGGEDVYLLVPADANATMVIEEVRLTDEGALEPTGETYYSGVGFPAILRCNVSDIMPNTVVTVTDEAGKTYAASPALSLRDGSVWMEGAYDFTEYPAGFERES